MTPQGPSTRRLRSLVMGVSLFHGMQKENTRRQQFDKVVDLPKGKLLPFQLKKSASFMSISMYSICMNIIIHLSYLRFTFQRNTDVLWYLFTISRKIIVLIFILKYESIVCKWFKALYNFLTQVVFFMEISKTESAEIKFLIHQNADL